MTTNHQIHIEQEVDERGRTVLVTTGDVDLQTAPELRRRIESAGKPGEDLVIDLRGVRFMDSPGLGTIIYCDRARRQQQDARLVLKDVTGPVRELVEMVRLADVIELE